jgi:hypothetical protein
VGSVVLLILPYLKSYVTAVAETIHDFRIAYGRPQDAVENPDSNESKQTLNTVSVENMETARDKVESFIGLSSKSR